MTTRSKSELVLATMLILGCLAASATSHVRIVRLSYTDGQVQMDRATGQGLERAILNAPIVEGTRLATGSDGLAEVEFENSSTLRLGENSEVKFRQLLMNDSGAKVNEIELVRGTAYFDTRSGKEDVYRLAVGDRTFDLRHDSQLRAVMDGAQVQVSLSKGEAELADNTGAVKLKKNETLTLDPASAAGYTVAKGIEKLPLDRWDDERGSYQSAYAYDNTGYGSRRTGQGFYGYQDLSYYGGFFNAPGYGLVWQPYGALNGMGWDPYGAGGWAYAPGIGYSWASAYPWGWLPYHYGAWAFNSGLGWFWVPGNSFNNNGTVTNFNPVAPVVSAPSGYHPVAPPPARPTSPNPVILVGSAGHAPATIPGGRRVPDFRSVIAPNGAVPAASGSAVKSGSATGNQNTNAATLGGANPKAGATFGQPSNQSSGSGGHVFARPNPWGASAAASSAGWPSAQTGTTTGHSSTPHGTVAHPHATTTTK